MLCPFDLVHLAGKACNAVPVSAVTSERRKRQGNEWGKCQSLSVAFPLGTKIGIPAVRITATCRHLPLHPTAINRLAGRQRKGWLLTAVRPVQHLAS